MLQQGPEAYVASAMDRAFVSFSPDMALADALPKLQGPGACAVVLDAEGQLVGMLTSEHVSQFILLEQATAASQKLHRSTA
jgi:hypothetical protein